MNSINKLAGFLGVLGVSSLISLPGFAAINLNQSAHNSLLLAQNSPGQSTTNPINDRGSSNDSTPGNVNNSGSRNSTNGNAVDDPCVRQGTRSDRRSSSYVSSDDQSVTAQNERCLEQQRNNSSPDSTTTPGTINTPNDSNRIPGSTTSP